MVGILHEFVLGYVTDNKGTVKDLRVYNLSTAKVTEVPVQMDGYYLNLSSRKDSHFLNLSIYKGILTPKFCGPLAMPRIHNGEVKGSNAWVLYAYEDGRLVLLSVTGQMKTVTEETAMSYHSRYGIVGCFIRQDGTFSVPSYAKRLRSGIAMDAEATRAILTLNYGLGADYDSLFIKACRECDEELAKQLLVSGKVNVQPNYKLALTIVCTRDSVEILRELLVALTPLDVDKLSTCKNIAKSQSSMNALNLLDEYEYRLEIEKHFKFTEPAPRKSKLFDREAAKAIIALKYPHEADLKSLFYAACSSGDVEVVNILGSSGLIDVHASGDFAFRTACSNGNIESVELLASMGADIHAQNEYALRWSCNGGHMEVVKFLLDIGADIHAMDEAPLVGASTYGKTDVVKLLLDSGADIHATDERALRMACSEGHLDTVKLLLENGADVHAKDDKVLVIAAGSGRADIVELLLAYGADASESARGSAALYTAQAEGHDAVIALLEAALKA